MRRRLSKKKEKVLRYLAPVFPRWFNKRLSSINNQWNHYFDIAEEAMTDQWNQIIWPLIKEFDFRIVLELAPGAGRNTEMLIQLASVIHAVDYNEYALIRLRERFKNYTGQCLLFFHKNEGSDLKMINNDSITTIYCWDSAVHFDKTIMREYIKEFSRVLQKNGKGFIHHSNLGRTAKVDFRENPQWRSNMSKELFQVYCEESGLKIIDQIDLPWQEVTDCISIFQN